MTCNCLLIVMDPRQPLMSAHVIAAHLTRDNLFHQLLNIQIGVRLLRLCRWEPAEQKACCVIQQQS